MQILFAKPAFILSLNMKEAIIVDPCGDPTQRWAAWEIAVKHTILTVDEIRQEEGWNPKEVQTV